MSRALPVAGPGATWRHTKALAAKRSRALVVCGVLHVLAAAAALVPPRLLGGLVGGLGHGLTRAAVDRTALILAVSVVAAAVLRRWARIRSFVVGEDVLAELREEFVEAVLALPLGTVEDAGTGDLLTRTTNDVEWLSRSVRFAVPEVLVALLTAVVTVVAMVLAAPAASVAALLAVPVAYVGTRWYVRRAPAAYLAERSSWSDFNARATETFAAGRTVEAFGLQQQRVALGEADLAAVYRAERATLRLRCLFFPSTELSYALPVFGTLLVGGLLAIHGRLSLAQVTAVTLYAQQLVAPVDTLLSWLDELQVGGTSLARLLGVRDVPPDREPSGVEPDGEDLRADDVHFAYVTDRDVLRAVDLTLRAGERLAIVGPSGAGKSTLGRLLAGIHPPRAGRVTVGDVDLVDLTIPRLRREVALVTQEHHVFSGSLADNLRLARPDASDEVLSAALAAVDWAGPPLEASVGPGSTPLTSAQAQQLALARLVLADPHTLVLDEATALLDPRAARHLERSLAAVLAGRTVVAIAHRLHTAADADRVAVVEDGRIVELGTHDELVAAEGAYAALWHTWQAGGPESAGG